MFIVIDHGALLTVGSASSATFGARVYSRGFVDAQKCKLFTKKKKLLFSLFGKSLDQQVKMSILAYNGGCVVAMKGKNCVAIATDHRFGVQAQTIATDFEKVFEINPHMYLGLVGLQTDILTVYQRLLFRKNLYEVRENRQMTPERFAAMLSNFLYEKRFGPYFIEPVIAGLDPKTYEPFICNMDLIGCPNLPNDFVVAGTCAEQLYGMCETLWKPDLEPSSLFEVISQALVNAFDRDAISGWGATVYIIEKEKITVKKLKTRMD